MPRGARPGEKRKLGKAELNRGAIARAEAVLATADAKKKLRSLSSTRISNRAEAQRGPAHSYEIDKHNGRDYVGIATRYARRVVAQELVACELMQLACARYLRMLDDDRFTLRRDRAARVCRFIESMPHAKGTWATPTITLEPWQVFKTCAVFGFYWSDAPERRVVKAMYEEVARKNAKSTYLAALGLYMLTEDGEEGAEVYSAATTHKQATAIFDTARSMAMRQRTFADAHSVTVGAHTISVWGTLSKFEALHSEGSTLDGLNIYAALVDELHAHKTRAVYDVLETAMGSRVNPLLAIITTAGVNRAGICYEVRDYVVKVLRGDVDDPSWFGAIYTIDREDVENWQDERVWAKANPNLCVSVQIDELRRLAKKAATQSSALNNFLTKHLNVWVNAGSSWLPAGLWDSAAIPGLKRDDFVGEECVKAADLASRVDVASEVTVFAREQDGVDHYYVFARHYLPDAVVRAASEDEAQHGQAQYSGWARDGWLQLCQGSVVDQDQIERDILSDAERFRVKDMGFDPYQAAALMSSLQRNGLEVVEVRPTVMNFSAPMKEVEALLKEGRLHHDGDPVLAWMASNVVCTYDAKDNVYPRKEFPQNKIDGIVALIMAFNRVIAHSAVVPLLSVYETRGVRTLNG